MTCCSEIYFQIVKKLKSEPMENDGILLEFDNYVTTLEACKDAHQYKRMISVIGEPGYGKSTALETYLNEYSDCVVYIDAQITMNAKLFYSSIYNEISGESYDPTMPLYFIIRRAANKFNEDSKNKLLIIDEAGKFSPKMLEYLHEFRDLTKSTTGIILAGPKYFEEYVIKWNKKMLRGIPEVYSRISVWIALKPPTEEETVTMIRAYGINDKEFEKYVIKTKHDFRAIKNAIDNYLRLKKKE